MSCMTVGRSHPSAPTHAAHSALVAIPPSNTFLCPLNRPAGPLSQNLSAGDLRSAAFWRAASFCALVSGWTLGSTGLRGIVPSITLLAYAAGVRWRTAAGACSLSTQSHADCVDAVVSNALSEDAARFHAAPKISFCFARISESIVTYARYRPRPQAWTVGCWMQLQLGPCLREGRLF